MGDKKSDYRRTFKSLQVNILACISQLDNDPMREPKPLSSLDFDQFWIDIVAISKKLCFEANKIGLAWINPPVPSNADMAGMTSCLEMACVALLGATASFPEEAGEMVNTQLRNVVVSILEACVSFAKTLNTTAGKKLPSQNHPLLQQFGFVMKHCEAVETLPKSNKDACIGVLNEEHAILKDAVNELKEAQESVDGNCDEDPDNETNDEKWMEDDKRIINPSLGLMKTTVALTKKTSGTIKKFGKIDTKEELSEYDAVVKVLAKLSPAVDDLAMTLYPPVSWKECQDAANNLDIVMSECLKFLDEVHFMTSEEAKSWKSFVEKAILHNSTEIKRVFAEHNFAGLSVEESKSDNSLIT